VTCPECRNVGYLLNERHTGGYHADSMQLELVACIYPDCKAPQVNGDPRPIDSLGVLEMFTEVTRHPTTARIMSLSGFTEANYR